MGGKRLEKYYCYKKQLFCGSEREIRGMVELAENIHTVRELLKSGNQGTVQCLFKSTPNLYILWNIPKNVSDNLWIAIYMITEFTGTTLLSVSILCIHCISIYYIYCNCIDGIHLIFFVIQVYLKKVWLSPLHQKVIVQRLLALADFYIVSSFSTQL